MARCQDARMGRVITSNGDMIGYALARAGEATPIVFLHGVGSDKSVWAPQLKHFDNERRAVAFDYPGYGDSDPASEGTTRDDYAKAILSAMHELAIDRAHVCGLSLGGVVAIAMAHLAPERCASLILADTFAEHPDGRAIYERSLAASSDMRALAEARVDVLLAQPADSAVRDEVVETMARIAPAAYRIGAEAVWLADQSDRAAANRAPTLVLCGAEDRITPPALSEELAKLIPGARFEMIDRAGHLSNLEHPDAFNALVEAFIRRADSPPS
jgi:3-oxoadipate enol-lactonase